MFTLKLVNEEVLGFSQGPAMLIMKSALLILKDRGGRLCKRRLYWCIWIFRKTPQVVIDELVISPRKFSGAIYVSFPCYFQPVAHNLNSE